MITKEWLNQIIVADEVAVFAAANCRSHVTMLNAWRNNPLMGASYPLLVQQLAYVTRHHNNKTVIGRILGRISVIRRESEVKEFGLAKDDPAIGGVLG